MAIHPITNFPELLIHNISKDSKYVCDLCGAQFASKVEATKHHKGIHKSDKNILDGMLSKVYVRKLARGERQYRYVISINYEKGTAIVAEFRYVGMDDGFHKWFWMDAKYSTKVITLFDLKYMYRFWEEVPNGLLMVYGEIEKTMNTMLDNIAIQGGDDRGY